MTKKLLLVGSSFVAGIVATVSLGAIRSAHADQEGPRSAYFCFESSDVTDLQVKANAAGQRGWEMVAATPSRGAGIWCFKQPR